jgi:hypothetical protein
MEMAQDQVHQAFGNSGVETSDSVDVIVISDL